MTNKLSYTIVACLLAFVFVITVLSITTDSLSMDELAHLPAGYSYLTQRDMRINPEHPPLVKDLSAIPLLFIKDIEFPYEIKSWKDDVNGQWEFGNYFLFKSGNPAEIIIFLARIPMILLLLVCGLYIFLLAKNLFGNEAGVLAMVLFALSPTFLAHGRLVTTDVGAATGTVIALYYFIIFLKNNTKKNLIFAGIALGIAELLKFSLILLIPLFGILAIGWAIVISKNSKEFFKNLLKYIGYCILIGLIALLVIWSLYLFHIWGYSAERQIADIKFNLGSFGSKPLVNMVVWMAGNPVLRPIAQYLHGLFMVLQRASGGNTGYFMGEISAAGWKTYFPVVYLIKETITFHMLTVAALLFFIVSALSAAIKTGLKNPIKNLLNWTKNNFWGLSLFAFIAIYWITSLKSNLNIGVRHLLPVFPFTIVLASAGVIFLIKKLSWSKSLKYSSLSILAILILFQAYSVISVYPNFIAYFNEAIGGPKQGYKYVEDSNLDWGQDLKRLNIWLEKNNIKKIYINYFGGSDLDYYLGNKYIFWDGMNNPSQMTESKYIAVSATLLQGGRGKPSIGYDSPTGYYNWLNSYEPIAVIGHSIFVYYIN